MPFLRTFMARQDDVGAKVAPTSSEMNALSGALEIVAVELERLRDRASPATGRAATATEPVTTLRAPKNDAIAKSELGIR